MKELIQRLKQSKWIKCKKNIIRSLTLFKGDINQYITNPNKTTVAYIFYINDIINHIYNNILTTEVYDRLSIINPIAALNAQCKSNVLSKERIEELKDTHLELFIKSNLSRYLTDKEVLDASYTHPELIANHLYYRLNTNRIKELIDELNPDSWEFIRTEYDRRLNNRV